MYPPESCVAIGNGVEYEKIKNNPVVTADMLSRRQ